MTELLEQNPLRAGMRLQRSPEPAAMVIFGSAGDLALRKLFPSLYRLHRDGVLPGGFTILGVARRPWSDEEFRYEIRQSLEEFLGEPVSREVWDGFAERLYFLEGAFSEEGLWRRLRRSLQDIDETRVHSGNRLFYLAVPPTAFEVIIDGLGRAGLAARGSGWSRVVIEKPFGRDLASARALNDRLRDWFREEQVFRMDHYLGKETVQNILVFRLSNGIFEPVWNRQYVDHVQITVAEDLGVEDRGDYYEESGAIRDIIQNHVYQLLALVAMEPPASFEAEAVRDEKVKVLRALRPFSREDVDRDVVRAAYGPGFIKGEEVQAYREEPKVAADSTTETFVAMRVFVDSWRWAGVPFYLRTGKRLPKRMTEVAIVFRRPPLTLFRGGSSAGPEPNVLVMHIQPDEGITLKFGSKVPGPRERIHPVTMEFRYGTSFGQRTSEAYERLLMDALLGDPTLFTRADGVEAAWESVDRILDRWRSPDAGPLCTYEAGTWGPREAEQLIEQDGREWRL
jgi:glucose-6-phosphate 1-dehydrogenase